ncbi:MAG TPA: hypothetical protein VGL72_22410 [Bryobacteraceae bacterium]|jgi:hypothetical protein
MKRRVIQGIFFTLLGGLTIYPALAEHPDFSGNWQLDVAASRFGTMAPAESGNLVISMGSHKLIDISMSTKASHQERTVDSQWKIDDHFHPIAGDAAGEVLAKWDGSVLVGKRMTPGGTVEETRFRLESGGSTMTEMIQNGLNVSMLVWHRQ